MDGHDLMEVDGSNCLFVFWVKFGEELGSKIPDIKQNYRNKELLNEMNASSKMLKSSCHRILISKNVKRK